MDFEKSMKYTNKKRTICECIREINDKIENEEILAWRVGEPETEERFKEIRILLKEIHTMAKKMTHKLYEYSKEWDKEFWDANPDYEQDLKRRLSE